MIFKELQIKNFQLFGNEEQMLDISQNGLKLISGDNGVGKSSLGYSIVWCLYGKTLQDSVDDVVNRYTKKNCKVSVTFIQDGIEYKVIRYRKHETHENNIYVFKGDKDISLRKAPDTNQLILDIIQTPYQAFINSTFFSTELYSKFMNAKTSERLSVFESLLSLKEVALFYDQAKTFHTEITTKLDETKILKAIKVSEKETIENSIREYSSKAKESLLLLKAEKTTLQDTLKFKEESLKEISNVDVEQELKNLENGKRVASIKERKSKKVLEDDLPSVEKEIEIIFKLKGFDCAAERKKEEEANSLKNEIALIEKDLIKVNSEIETLSKDISTKENEIKNFTKELDVLKKEEESLKESICILCKQHVDEAFILTRKAELKELLNTINENITMYNIAKQNLNSKLDIKKQEKRAFDEIKYIKKNTMPELKYSNINEIEKQFEAAKKAVDYYDKEQANIDSRNAIVRKELEEIEKELADLNYVPKYTEEFILNIKEVVSKTEKEIISIINKISEIDGKASAVYDKSYVEHQKIIIEKIELVIANYIKEEDAFKEEDKYFIFLMDCFSNKENSFKKFFIGEMIETFNEKINQYLPFFFEDEIKISFDKELNATIVMNELEISYSSFSSGQKARAEMSVAFALFNLSRIFFSSETNLLIIDEILDANVDQRGIESALMIVEGLSSETGIFVISHNQEMKDRIKNKIEIRKDSNGFSIIKGA